MSGLNVREAQDLLWETLTPGVVERRPLLDAVGLVLAESLSSDLDFPPFDRMAMDGYAVRSTDTQGASLESPARLRIVGTAAAGAPFEARVGAGEAVKAMTGAPLPAGADAVVRIEDTAGWSDSEAVLHAQASPGQHVSPRGEELAAGERVLSAGTRLGSQHVQALASAGWARVPVISPPTAAVLSTGQELIPITERPAPGQVRESNGACIEALLSAMGIPVGITETVTDDPELLRRRVSDLLSRHELLVMSGGVSKGERDYVKEALESCGVSLRFQSLHLRPGHPATFGVHGGGAVFALPGNPVAVYATLLVVFSVGLRRRMGYAEPRPPATWARLGFAAHRRGDRPQLLPVRLEATSTPELPRAHSTGHHGSGDFVSLARADALAWLEDERVEFPPGTVVPVYPFPGRAGG